MLEIKILTNFDLITKILTEHFDIKPQKSKFESFFEPSNQNP